MQDNFRCSGSQSTTLSCSAHSVYVAVWPDTSEERSVKGVASPKRTRAVIALAPLLKDDSAGSFAIAPAPLLTSSQQARSYGSFDTVTSQSSEDCSEGQLSRMQISDMVHEFMSSVQAHKSDGIDLKATLNHAMQICQHVCNAWLTEEEEGCRDLKRHEEERRELSAKLMSTKEMVEDLRRKSFTKDEELVQRDRQLSSERTRSQRLECELKSQKSMIEALKQEHGALKRKLRESPGSIGRGPTDRIERRIAEMEFKPLQKVDGPEKIVLQKKLMLKWHPDKQPSSEHRILATQVMQELQNHPDWHR